MENCTRTESRSRVTWRSCISELRFIYPTYILGSWGRNNYNDKVAINGGSFRNRDCALLPERPARNHKIPRYSIYYTIYPRNLGRSNGYLGPYFFCFDGHD